ncbi:acyl carrier protein [Fibrobacterota bacterium]
MDDELKNIIAEALGRTDGQLDENATPDNTPEWDSFGMVKIVTTLESHFKIQFSTDDIIELKSYLDIKKVLVQKGVLHGNK